MAKRILMIIQAPNRNGQRGHQFLVTRVDPNKLDPALSLDEKDDAFILHLEHIRKTALKQFRTGVESTAFVRHLILTRQAPNQVIQIELNYALPTRTEVARATDRRNQLIQQQLLQKLAEKKERLEQEIKQFEERIMLCSKYIDALQRKIDEYRAYLKQPNLLSGIRLHYERVLIMDCRRDLNLARNERTSLQGRLVHAAATRTKLKIP